MFKRLLVVGVALVVAAGAFAAPSSAAEASGTRPRVRITPNIGLADGQSVKVKASGFAPSSTVGILECVPGATDAGACDYNTLVVVPTDAAGALTVPYTVSRITDQFGSPYDCAPTACELTVSSGPDFATSARTTMNFDPAIPPLPAPVISITIDPTGTVVAPHGSANLSGTVTCNRPILVNLDGTLRQRAGRAIYTATLSGSVACKTGTQHWAKHVAPGTGLYRPGSATLTVTAFGFAGGQPAFAQATQKLTLVAG